MLIEHPHFVHPVDVEMSGTLRGPFAEPDNAVHPDYVAEARVWLEQHLVGEYNRLVAEDVRDRAGRYGQLRARGLSDAEARAQLVPRWIGRGEPVVRALDEPYTTADGRTWQLPYTEAGVTYEVGWIGTIEARENPDWSPDGP